MCKYFIGKGKVNVEFWLEKSSRYSVSGYFIYDFDLHGVVQQMKYDALKQIPFFLLMLNMITTWS